MFEKDFFNNKPAIAGLKGLDNPKPDHLRACILELCAHIIKQDEQIAKLTKLIGIFDLD